MKKLESLRFWPEEPKTILYFLVNPVLENCHVEGLAQRIISGDVPENPKSKTLIFGYGFVGGRWYKGEFEERLKADQGSDGF